MANTDFFYKLATNLQDAIPIANQVIKKAQTLPAEVNLMISDRPLAIKVSSLSPEHLLGLIAYEKIHLVQGIVDLMSLLGTEIRKGSYSLNSLLEEVSKLPSFTSNPEQSLALQEIQQKGSQFSDLPQIENGIQTQLLDLSKKLNISLEYLLGNLGKVNLLIKHLGVRLITLNVSSLFHNYQSGFYEIDLQNASAIKAPTILKRAKALKDQGTTVEIFQKGEFNRKLTEISVQELEECISDTEDGYQVSSEDFSKFIDALFKFEEKRLKTAPTLSLQNLLACFRFSTKDRDVVAVPAVIQQDDPLRWKETPLGQALLVMRENLNWLAVSIGIKNAGDFETLSRDPEIDKQVETLIKLSEGLSITLLSSQKRKVVESPINELKKVEILFSLYCVAVLEKRKFVEVLEAAVSILRFIHNLENHDPIVNLNDLIIPRLAGETYVTLLGTQGLILRNTPIVYALGSLRSLQHKVQFTVQGINDKAISLKDISIEDFRRAVIMMGRQLKEPHSPERVLAIIRDKVVPEIAQLPQQVIAEGEHDLGRVVELCLLGVPPRYPLRRPWKKINLDPLTYMGSGLEPGIRNCLGCPVNSLYGLVIKSAIADGFDEIITYEATGCFEVYSGIWPYTGKKLPSIHGVFGGAPSELLGGLAAKRARYKFARKTDAMEAYMKANGERILHLGWGGDGATFDIGFGNLSGLFSRLQKLSKDELAPGLFQRGMYVCYDNEGYQNTGNQFSAASAPGGYTTTNPMGKAQPLGNDLRKKPIVEIIADHGVPLSARMNIHRQEHITRVISRALEDGAQGSFIHFLQPCTTGWKFAADNLTYDLAGLSEEGGLFPPVTIEYGVAYLEMYPTPRNLEHSFLKLQSRFRHLMGSSAIAKENMQLVMNYYHEEWHRNLKLTGYEGELPRADRLGYLEEEHRKPRITS
ncbi:hypothetical protein WDW89_12350 [Deltaproteobacteria bacterium TL4]